MRRRPLIERSTSAAAVHHPLMEEDMVALVVIPLRCLVYHPPMTRIERDVRPLLSGRSVHSVIDARLPKNDPPLIDLPLLRVHISRRDGPLLLIIRLSNTTIKLLLLCFCSVCIVCIVIIASSHLEAFRKSSHYQRGFYSTLSLFLGRLEIYLFLSGF